MSDRRELVKNAVEFLSDSKIQAAPLTKRISFLESKGLTTAEIEDAISQSASSSTTSRPSSIYSVPQSQFAFQSPPTTVVVPPPIPQRDWRDYFIMALVSGGLMYGLTALARKYVAPHLQPPSEDAFEATTSQLTAQFDEAAALLKQIQEDTVNARDAVQQQQQAVDSAIEQVKNVMSELRTGEEKSQNEMREIRSEVDAIRDMLPKMLEANREAQTHALSELQQEVKSLKALLVTRRPESPSAPSSILNLGRPSIPAWQLSGGSDASTPGNAKSPAPEGSSTAGA
ncbi:putative peroxisomal membrane anchor protein (Pex14) [Rhizoctonia solani 123E]|uniref:Peroxisomal membrane protein PEX14 n=1 Tax=Rhizoctonia solani 123E TaxID=1423351 RepID=A0A074S7U4_9AGAM|nr:putative peroxisomal membrane anchor protein (Pex14) [Rhizoctonia solani 123E]